MPTETLICSVGGHTFSRERKRGVKPKICPDHKAEGAVPDTEIVQRITGPSSLVSDDVLRMLDDDAINLDPELRHKLEYTVTQMQSPRRDDEGKLFMRKVQDELMREARRAVGANV